MAEWTEPLTLTEVITLHSKQKKKGPGNQFRFNDHLSLFFNS